MHHHTSSSRHLLTSFKSGLHRPNRADNPSWSSLLLQESGGSTYNNPHNPQQNKQNVILSCVKLGVALLGDVKMFLAFVLAPPPKLRGNDTPSPRSLLGHLLVWGSGYDIRGREDIHDEIGKNCLVRGFPHDQAGLDSWSCGGDGEGDRHCIQTRDRGRG